MCWSLDFFEEYILSIGRKIFDSLTSFFAHDKYYILTYRNYSSYISMVFFIFLTLRSNSDQNRMKLGVCKA